jgi:choline dehydrogenase
LHGVGYEQSTTFKGKRRSSADSFLKPVIGDERLTLVTEARANRLLFDGHRAIGVEYVKDGEVHQAKAKHEVVLTAGAFATPKLLMLSGIGPADHLAQFDIRVIADLPGVGQNLQDHNEVFLSLSTKGPFGYFGEDAGIKLIRNVIQYYAFGTGSIALNGIRDDGVRQFGRSRRAARHPNLLHWFDVANTDGQSAQRGYASGQSGSSAFLRVRSLEVGPSRG